MCLKLFPDVSYGNYLINMVKCLSRPCGIPAYDIIIFLCVNEIGMARFIKLTKKFRMRYWVCTFLSGQSGMNWPKEQDNL